MTDTAIGNAPPPTPASTAGRSLGARIRKRLFRGGAEFELDLDLTFAPGFTILFGASGAGKTTLLDCIAGLAAPDSGLIANCGRTWFDSDSAINLPVQHRGIGYLFQDLALFPHLTVEQNVQYGLAKLSSAERSRRSAAILESFRIAHLRLQKPGKISGGERQRVALARALVTEPTALLLDEPLSALDAPAKSRIIDDLRRWNEANNIPILYVTHNREEVFALGERVIILENGKVVAEGTPHEVMTAPRSETVAQLSGFENILDATVLAAHEDRGTMTCRLHQTDVDLETPLVKAAPGSRLRIGIRAGDVLLAASRPQGLSARNLIPGVMASLFQRDVIVIARVSCGVEIEVHLTLAARDALHLQPGNPVWLVIKTHSCHLMAASTFVDSPRP